MKIVINSHKNSTIALNHLLESMGSQTDYEVLIAIGGYYEKPTYEIKKEGNLTYIYCNHNSIDYTGLIALYDLYSKDVDEHYFYTHDTCRVGPEFYTKLKSIDLTNVSSIRLNRGFSMNMGIYSQKVINHFKDFLIRKTNRSEENLLHFKVNNNEDYLFIHDPTNIVLENYNGHKYTGPTDYYKTGTPRIVEYYPNIDLYKIKANWGQGTWTLKN